MTLYIGLMSGTSMDAIDAALVDFSDGVKLLHSHSLAIPKEIRQQSRALNHSADGDLQQALVLDRKWAYLFAELVQQLVQESGIDNKQIRAIGSHGQTVRHAPTGQLGYTLQIGDPNTIAEITGITVVADFRRRDVAAGGQGAPLAPAFHQAILGNHTEKRAVINIGGMANITELFKNPLIGFDCGPGNVLMDSWIEQNLGKAYDRNGEWAASGKVLPDLLQCLLDEPFFALPAPKSTGREMFDQHWLKKKLRGNENACDVQATLAELTALSISNALDPQTEALYVCGGGAFNTYLMSRINAISGKPTFSTDRLGVPAQWMEAMAFAWLAKQTLEGKTCNLSSVTGARGDRILGAIYQA